MRKGVLWVIAVGLAAAFIFIIVKWTIVEVELAKGRRMDSTDSFVRDAVSKTKQ